MNTTYETLALAYKGNLDQLMKSGNVAPPVTDPLSPASRFGARPRGARELIGHSFRVNRPVPSILKGAEVKLDLQFLFGQFVWFIAGSDDLSWLSYYAQHATLFSHDGNTLCGSFGRRIFGTDAGSSQVGALVALLRNDPGSRRGLISIAEPRDMLRHTKEFPCCSSLHFFVRDQQLHLVCTMRAQQALTVLPYDSFLFIGLLHVLASELNVTPGFYVHASGTIHFYDNELATAQRICGSEVAEVELPAWASGMAGIARVVEWEARVRMLATSGDKKGLSALAQSTTIDTATMEGLLMMFCVLVATDRMKMAAEHAMALTELRRYGF